MINQMMSQAKALLHAGMVLGAIKYHLYLTGRPITYVALAKVLGMFSGGKVLSEALGNAMLVNIDNNEPLYSSAVVGSKTGLPGDGFFKFARLQGLKIPETEQGEHEFWAEQVTRLGYNPNNWIPQTVRPMLYVDNIQVSENLFFVMQIIPSGLFQRIVLLFEQGVIVRHETGPFPIFSGNSGPGRANFIDYNTACEMLDENNNDYDLSDAVDEFRSLRPEDRAHLLRNAEKRENVKV